MDKVRLNLHRKNIQSLHNIRQDHKQKIGGAAYVPTEALLNVTRQQKLDVPHMVKHDSQKIQGYRKPIMKEKSSI